MNVLWMLFGEFVFLKIEETLLGKNVLFGSLK